MTRKYFFYKSDYFTSNSRYYLAWIEGFAIFCAVFISAGVQAINDYQKELQFRELNQAAIDSTKITAVRDGDEIEIRLAEVVVGDIIKVVAGDEIPGDAILLSGSSVMCDEASMTGESDVIHKESQSICLKKRDHILEEGLANGAGIHEVPSPVLLSGTNIKNGKGFMLIIAVGDNSAIGKIRRNLVNNDDDTTPLQKKLSKLADAIGWFGLSAAVLTFLVMILRVIIKFAFDGAWDGEKTDLVVRAFLMAITVLVVAIPEGLPLAVTLSLAFSVKKMMKEENLVRKLHACETMGGADYICSDKTGTLTKNKMYLTHFWNCEGQQIYDNTTGNIVKYSEFVGDLMAPLFLQSICLNSTADADTESGNPTELAMVRYVSKCGIDVKEYRKKFEVVADEPFSSDRKRMSTLFKNEEEKTIMVIKGASELILDCCTELIDIYNGETCKITPEVVADINIAIKIFAEKSLRTIGIAYKECSEGDYDKNDKDKHNVLNVEKSGLTLLGICGIKDVIREEVPDAVEKCRRAGIQVKMVTGDNKITAEAIAKECNIIEEGKTDPEYQDYEVMLGKDFYDMVGGYSVLPSKKKNKKIYTVTNSEKFTQIYKHVKVLARSRPEDKLTMVIGLKERGHIVAVTGDGTNDAPALSKANVGFAMGVTGTEIAKQAADILLTDDNFNSIVSAVKWGRNIYDSVSKFLQFQLTVNLVAVCITFVSAAITMENVLTAVQLLWVNLSFLQSL